MIAAQRLQSTKIACQLEIDECVDPTSLRPDNNLKYIFGVFYVLSDAW